MTNDQPPLLNNMAWHAARQQLRDLRSGLPSALDVALRKRLVVAEDSFVIREDVITAAGTPRRRFVVEPAIWLQKLLVALRAGDLDAVARFAHGGSFQ